MQILYETSIDLSIKRLKIPNIQHIKLVITLAIREVIEFHLKNDLILEGDPLKTIPTI